MKIYYRNQLPGKGAKEFKLDGIIGTIIGILVTAAVIALFVFVILPFALIGILIFVAFILFAIGAGWIWLGFKIGWRNLWEFTKLFFSIAFGRSGFSSKSDRMKQAWKNYSKGRPGEWVK